MFYVWNSQWAGYQVQRNHQLVQIAQPTKPKWESKLLGSDVLLLRFTMCLFNCVLDVDFVWSGTYLLVLELTAEIATGLPGSL